MVLHIEGLDPGLGGFGFVEVLVNGGCLRFAESNEVDDVREDFDQTVMSWFQKIGEGKVGDTALFRFGQDCGINAPDFDLLRQVVSAETRKTP